MAEIPKGPKLCWWCDHFMYSNHCPDYSEYTPGNSFELDCCKDKWRFNAEYTDLDGFRACITAAENCADFTPIPPPPTAEELAKIATAQNAALGLDGGAKEGDK